MKQSNWEVVTKQSCLLGEGPIWDNKQKRILWIDILKGDIHCFYPDNNKHKTFNTGKMVGAIGLRKSGGIIAAIRGEFATINLNKGTIECISEVEPHLPDNRFNDGKCDPAGRFWAGTMAISNTPHAGSLYALNKDYTVDTKISGVSCSNGLAWSPDHKTLYYIDTPTRNVVAYNYDLASGHISDKRVVIIIPKGEGYPDGMTIDNEGMIWIALWDGWKVIRYNPYTGKQLNQFLLPVARVTSCIFGGDTMEDLYITSARIGLLEDDLKTQPLAGCLFVIKNCGFKGMDGFEFNG